MEPVGVIMVVACVASLGAVGYTVRARSRLKKRTSVAMERLAAGAGFQKAPSLVRAGMEALLPDDELELGSPVFSQVNTASLQTAHDILFGKVRGREVICCTLTMRSDLEEFPVTSFLSRTPVPLPWMRLYPRAGWSRPVFEGSPSKGKEFDALYGLDTEMAPEAFTNGFNDLREWLAAHPGWDVQAFEAPPWVVASRAPAPAPDALPGLLDEFVEMLGRLPRVRPS